MSLSKNIRKSSKKVKELDDFTRGMICGLAMKANWKLAQISRELDIPVSTVGDVVRKYRDHGIKTVQLRSGRLRKLTERDLRHVAISAR
ncbi:hypothetical protein G6F56_002832 [Rhizopus delemar]|nr:hypothetical protein G6F56_002832 [Rhizopus delemar]